MSDAGLLDVLHDLERRIGQTEVKEVPLSGVYCRVFNTSAISIVTATNTALTFDSETYDTDGMHSTSANTGRLTCVHAGNYHIWGNVEFASNATGVREVFIRRNGADVLAVLLVPACNGAVTVLAVATDFLLSVGDYVELLVFQNSGGNLNVDAANFYTPYFGMTRIA